MYQEHTLTVGGSEMPVLLFAPDADGPHPGLVIAQHLPLAHTGLTNDPYQIAVGERYAANGYFCAMPFLFHRFAPDTDIAVKRAEFRDDQTVDDMRATFDLLASQPSVDAGRIGVLGHCWGGRVSWLAACHDDRYRACVLFYGGRVKLPFADGGPPPITLASRIPARWPVSSATRIRIRLLPTSTTTRRRFATPGSHANSIATTAPDTGFQTSNMPERYREQVSEDAWGKALDFLARHLA